MAATLAVLLTGIGTLGTATSSGWLAPAQPHVVQGSHSLSLPDRAALPEHVIGPRPPSGISQLQLPRSPLIPDLGLPELGAPSLDLPAMPQLPSSVVPGPLPVQPVAVLTVLPQRHMVKTVFTLKQLKAYLKAHHIKVTDAQIRKFLYEHGLALTRGPHGELWVYQIPPKLLRVRPKPLPKPLQVIADTAPPTHGPVTVAIAPPAPALSTAPAPDPMVVTPALSAPASPAPSDTTVPGPTPTTAPVPGGTEPASAPPTDVPPPTAPADTSTPTPPPPTDPGTPPPPPPTSPDPTPTDTSPAPAPTDTTQAPAPSDTTG